MAGVGMGAGEDEPMRHAPPAQSWRELLIYRKPGYLEPGSQTNAIVILQNHPDWRDVFVLNEFSDQITLMRCPPWMDESDFKVRRIKNSDYTETKAMMERDGLNLSRETIINAIEVVAQNNRVHPVRDYFDGLEWDGINRLDTWLRDYLCATGQEADYLAAVGAKWLIGAVRRIYEPGAKHDFMLVLEGPQNAGKSLALRTIATFGDDIEETYFTDALRFENISHPSSISILQGKIIIEFAELAGMSKKETDDIKNWITIPVDEIQKKYQNASTVYPRQFVIAGTTNEDSWLRDPTGNRRFMPVKCKGRIDIDGLKRDRKQLWAEAVYRCRELDEPNWIDFGSKAEALAFAEQEQRLMEDAWHEAVLNISSGVSEITIPEIMAAIPLEPGRRDVQAVKRIGAILRQGGWEKVQKWRNGRNVKVWINPAMRGPGTAELPLAPHESRQQEIAQKLKGTDWDFE